MAADTVIVGSGNVASHLAAALGRRLLAVCSRNAEHARELAEAAGVPAWGELGDIAAFNPAIVLISVADNAIDAVAETIGVLPSSPLVLHTSGTIHKERLSRISPRTGVLYPLQTFSKGTAVDMAKVPFFTEAAYESDYPIVDGLARCISSVVHHADAEQRSKLHIAGVFSSNFIVEMLDITGKVLGEENYPLDTVRPLVEATIAKVFAIGPFDALTGPARRGDKAVIERQSASLPDDERKIYDIISQYIIKTHDITLR